VDFIADPRYAAADDLPTLVDAPGAPVRIDLAHGAVLPQDGAAPAYTYHLPAVIDVERDVDRRWRRCQSGEGPIVPARGRIAAAGVATVADNLSALVDPERLADAPVELLDRVVGILRKDDEGREEQEGQARDARGLIHGCLSVAAT
jgi:hypothetical protein